MSDWERYKDYVRETNPEIVRDIDEVEEIAAIVESNGSPFAMIKLDNYLDEKLMNPEFKKEWDRIQPELDIKRDSMERSVKNGSNRI